MSRSAWSWSASERARHTTATAALPADSPLRPRQMLATFGYDGSHTCGTCRHFWPRAARGHGACRKALQGHPPGAGYAWWDQWKACGAWEPAAANSAPDPSPVDQPRLL